MFGSPALYRHLAGRIAKAADAVVDLPQYRLAPEHPFPAATDDGLAAYRSVIERLPADRVVVAGDSAGGNLVLNVLQAARDAGLPMPAGLVLLSPWLDLSVDPASLPNAESEILILAPAIAQAIEWYRGELGADDPRVSPLHGSMDGLPPTLVQVSNSEALYHDSLAFVDAARAAGVEVSIEVEDGLWHDWQMQAPIVPEARHSIASIGRFVVARVP